MILGFLDKLKAQCIKEKIDKPDFIKIKNFCSLKTLRGWKDKLQTVRKYLQRIYLMNDLYPENKKNFQYSKPGVIC